VKKPSKKNVMKSDMSSSDDYLNDSLEIPTFVKQASEIKKKKEEVAKREEPESKQNIISQILENAAITNLSTAKANWYFGEWKALVDIDIQALNSHPDVAKFAALKAAGFQQLNKIEESKTYFKLARKLGCDNQIISQLLIAGIHNALGKVSALQSDDDKTLAHFDAAVCIGDNSQDNRLARQARSVKEISKLGLLPQAAKLLTTEKEAIDFLSTRPSDYQAQMKILTSEVEIINHELMLAYEKTQLYANTEEGISIYNSDGSINKEKVKRLSPSQLGQDLWVLEQTNYKRKGFFVEFGATDGVLLSNSYLLEKEFEWQGLCAEPNPKYFKQLQVNRNCITSDVCISKSTGESVEFIFANEYGGIADIAREGKHGDKVKAYESEKNTVSLETISLNDFLINNNAPKYIDYLSIDTEGSEYHILSEFPFCDWMIHCISVEHNYEPQRELIHELLISIGYERTKSEWDDLYVMDLKFRE
jgi:FkbM family methyltransferase